MKIKVLCTLGPASLRKDVIQALEARGVDLFRINLAYTPTDNVLPAIELVRRYSNVPICLDTQGAQVRCGPMADGIRVERGRRVELTAEAVDGSAERFTIGPASVFVGLRPGDQIKVHSGGPLLQVDDTGDGRARTTVLESGPVRSNKVLSIDPQPLLAPLTDADVAAIEIGAAAGIRHFALSFASCAADVELLRALVPEGATVISKVESRVGVRHRDEIIDLSDAVIVDRGDLSREVPVEYVPYYQKAIIRQANRWNRPAYVATNLLETMVTSRNPSIAELNDIANILLDGVHGLVLAAETAIGIDPVGSVDMVQRCIGAVEHSTSGSLLEDDRMLSGTDVARLAS